MLVNRAFSVYINAFRNDINAFRNAILIVESAAFEHLQDGAKSTFSKFS